MAAAAIIVFDRVRVTFRYGDTDVPPLDAQCRFCYRDYNTETSGAQYNKKHYCSAICEERTYYEN